MSFIGLLGVLAMLAADVVGVSVPHDVERGGTIAFRDGPRGVDVLVGDELFTTLRTEGVSKPALFPVLAPGGVHVTRGYPLEAREGEEKDHPHHTSLWFAHGSVNGHDFWHGAKGERIVASGEARREMFPDRGVITCSFEWRSSSGEVVCTERRIMTFRADEASRSIDFDLTLTAGAAAVTFGDTKEGTFAMRLREELRLKGGVAAGRIVSSTGARDGACWGKRAAWVEYSGRVEGKTLSVAMFDHPENPRHPTWWHARDYGLFAANPFGTHDFEGGPAGAGEMKLDAGDSVRFRYRVTVHDGGRTPAELEAEFEAFAAVPTADAKR